MNSSSYYTKKKEKNYSFFQKEKERFKEQQRNKEIENKIKKNIQEEKIKNLSNKEYFPAICDTKHSVKETIKFENIIKNEENNDNNECLVSSDNEYLKNNNKWLILNKNNIENYKIEKNNEKSIKQDKEYSLSQYEVYNYYANCVKRWNNFRNEQNYLLGDLSPYYNYQFEIDNLVHEENLLLEEIYTYSNYYSSDEDNNDFDNDDFYYAK